MPLYPSFGGTAGTTDNALVRGDGTSGKAIQGSSAVLDDSGNLTLPDAATFQIGDTAGASGGNLQFTATDQYAIFVARAAGVSRAQQIVDVASGNYFFDAAGEFRFRDAVNGATRFVISNAGIPILRGYTVAGLPAAATYTAGLIYVSNGTANKRLAISDGTNWRFPDGAIVS